MTSALPPEWSAGGDAFAKSCCAAIYESPIVRYLLGDCWHPGGIELTRAIGEALGLSPADCVLDVACGHGASVRALAEGCGCSVVGIDLISTVLSGAAQAAERAKLGDLAAFLSADAETLPFRDGSFDVVLCECALCTFPNKQAAVQEMARVLRPGGRIAVADVTLEPGALPGELSSILSRVLCVADALPLAEYAALLAGAGLTIVQQEDCRWAALDFLKAIDQKLLVARIAQAVSKLQLEGVDLQAARRILALVRDIVLAGRLSYGYVIARQERGS